MAIEGKSIDLIVNLHRDLISELEFIVFHNICIAPFFIIDKNATILISLLFEICEEKILA